MRAVLRTRMRLLQAKAEIMRTTGSIEGISENASAIIH